MAPVISQNLPGFGKSDPGFARLAGGLPWLRGGRLSAGNAVWGLGEPTASSALDSRCG